MIIARIRTKIYQVLQWSHSSELQRTNERKTVLSQEKEWKCGGKGGGGGRGESGGKRINEI